MCAGLAKDVTRVFCAVRQNMSRVFAPILAKSVAHIPWQEVTLLYTLYRIPLSLAMFSRKEVLIVGIDAALEVRDAREPGKAQAVTLALLFWIRRNRWSSVHRSTFQGIRQTPARPAHRCLFDNARVAKGGTMG